MKSLNNCRINVMVSDMEKAIDFYTKKLGLTLLNHWGNHYAEIQAPGLMIGLHPSSEKTVKGNNMSIGLGVSDFDDAVDNLKSLGIRLNTELDGWIRLAHFEDCDGNQLFLAENKS